MAIKTIAQFKSNYTSSSGIYKDNASGDISPEDLRDGFTDTWDSWTNADDTLSGRISNLSGSIQTNATDIDLLQSGSGIATGYFESAIFGDIDGGNYSEFQEDTGFQMSYGSGMAWEDLRFPASTLNPPGSVGDADVDNTDTPFIGTLLFTAGGTEIICGQAQMPHSWKEGSTIHPHVHWAPTNTDTGDVYWQFDYDIANVGGTYSGVYSTIFVTDAADGTTNKHQLAELGQINMSGYLLSTMILWRLSRIGGDGADTYNADARLLEFDIHYQIDSNGSRQEYTK